MVGSSEPIPDLQRRERKGFIRSLKLLDTTELPLTALGFTIHFDIFDSVLLLNQCSFNCILINSYFHKCIIGFHKVSLQGLRSGVCNGQTHLTSNDSSAEIDVDDAGGEGGQNHSQRGEESAHHHHRTAAEAVHQDAAQGAWWKVTVRQSGCGLLPLLSVIDSLIL